VSRFQAVFLDLGNTLLSERPSRVEIHAALARDHGLLVTESEMSALLSRAHATLPREIDGNFRYSDGWFRSLQWRVFVEQLGLRPARFEALSAALFARFEDPTSFALYPGARELLAGLRASGATVGLISNWSEHLPRLLAALDLSPAFDFVLGSATVRAEKPDPAIFRAALARARAAPEQCVHAGDDPERDARGALSVGMSAILVDHDGRLGAAERGLCPVAGSLVELRDLILCP
jgi:putative hydrolase of the HAD superfamily